MPQEPNDYCCCQLCPIVFGVYAISVSCLIQGAYGMCLILTSRYNPMVFPVNFAAVICYSFFFPAGMCILLANLYESAKCAVLAGVVVIVVSVANFIVTVFYFGIYYDFEANSQLDVDFFWKQPDDWISENDVPFTLWHILTVILVFTGPVMCYYGFVVCILSKSFTKRREGRRTVAESQISDKAA